MTTLEKKIEAVRVANLIIKQLTDTTDVNVLMSWGGVVMVQGMCEDVTASKCLA